MYRDIYCLIYRGVVVKEIIGWLIGIEDLAAKVYEKAALRLEEDKEFADFSRHISVEEKEHHNLMLKAQELTKNRKDYPSLIFLAEDRKQDIENQFLLNEKRIATGKFTKENFIDLIATTEFSEWNDMFLYVCNTLKHEFEEYVLAVAMIQRHKRGIEQFIESRPEYAKYLDKIKHLPKIWEEKLLVVDDEDVILDLLSTVLEDEGIIDTASDGAEGLKKLGEEHYGVIVTDFDMPIMNGKNFYNEAVAKYPNIKGRFLFFTGAIDEERSAFFKDNGIKYLQKPSQIKDIRKAVVDIICR
jgi:CheY-like chemotaxis protein